MSPRGYSSVFQAFALDTWVVRLRKHFGCWGVGSFKTSSCRKQQGRPLGRAKCQQQQNSCTFSSSGNFEGRLPFACAEPEHSHLQAKGRFLSNALMSFGGKRGLLPSQHKCRLQACELAQRIKVLATKPEDLSSIPGTLMVVGEN